METTFFRKKTTQWGAVLCALGLALAMFAIYANALKEPADRTLLKAALDFLLFGATTLLSLGLVSMILDMKGWKDYFEDGLMNIVLRPDYLKRLSPDQLIEYQIEVFKKYYKREDIHQEGRFLRYCLGHIHKYIVEPFREDIREELRVKVASPDRLRISETLRYVCRAGQDGIQERLVWGTNAETLAVESLRFELQMPTGYTGEAGVSGKLEWTKDELDRKEENGLIDYTLDLKPFRQVDRLDVTVQATYLVDPNHFNTWRMIVPSRHVDVAIVYPKEFQLQFIPFLLDTRPDHHTSDPGFFSVEFRSWIMPWSGFAWTLFPRKAAQVQAFIPDELESVAG
jgi:hypothetical protein